MKQESVKGQCEHCGYYFEGVVTLKDGSFPPIKCTNCGKQTENFDSANEVDALNKIEGDAPIYNKINISHE